MSYKGIAKGKTIELEEPLPYPEGQPVSVFVEPVGGPLPAGSPAAIRQVMHEPPHLTWEDVEVFERAIAEAKLPVQDQRVFPEDESR